MSGGNVRIPWGMGIIESYRPTCKQSLVRFTMHTLLYKGSFSLIRTTRRTDRLTDGRRRLFRSRAVAHSARQKQES